MLMILNKIHFNMKNIIILSKYETIKHDVNITTNLIIEQNVDY